jgi:DNA-binding NarL/FixJ family response regulator
MSADGPVISVGANAELVQLRNFVLQEAGFHVISTVDEGEALSRIERRECGVLVMCYSLPSEVKKKLTEALRSCCPDSRIVAIANKQIEEPLLADAFVYGVEGPEALIEAVRGATETGV